jgi:alcohol dehydrogenase
MEFEAMMSRCIYGEQAYKKIAYIAKELRCSKAICIFDQGVHKAGLVEPVLAVLKKAGIAYITFDKVMPDPTVEIVDAVAELARAEKINLIISIGGSNSMDTAKAVNLLLNNPGSIVDYFGFHHDVNPGVPLIVIPTTAGTGSEMTAVSVLNDIQNDRKVVAKSWKMLPTAAILDPTMMLGLPCLTTAYTGMDALSHACEGFTCIKANPFTDALCLSAVKLIFANLVQAVKDGSNVKVRGNLAIAATQAGIGFGYSGVHLGHGMAHAMGAQWHIPHGLGCALALPYAILYVGARCGVERMRQLAQAMGLDIPLSFSVKQATKCIVSKISMLAAEIGIPTLRQLGIEKSELDNIVNASMKEIDLINCSGISFDEKMCREIYLQMFKEA